MPLAIVYPDVHFVLCDSIGKNEGGAGGRESAGIKQCDRSPRTAEDISTNFDFVVSRL